MVSGGPLTPAINKMRRTGAISHNTMMHFYQLASLTMLYGLFADYGYQSVYNFLTGATFILAWSSYAIFSFFFADAKFEKLDEPGLLAKLEKAVL